MLKNLASFLLLSMLLPIVVPTLLTACHPKNLDTDLQLVLRENPQSLDPVMSQDAIAAYALGPVYESPLQYEYLKRPYQLTTNLAAEMPKYSPDGLTVTVTLKQNVRFQNDPCFPKGEGREVTADDFIYAFKRVLDPKTKSEGFWIFDGKVVGANKWREEAADAPVTDYSKPVEGFKSLDKYTLQIKLVKKYPQFNYILTMPYTSPIPHEAVEKYGVEFSSHPVGTGPFVLKEYIRNSHLLYERNPNYRKEYFPERSANSLGDTDFDYGKLIPFADRMIVHVMIERQPAWLSFLKGGLDQVEIPKDSFESAVSDGQLKPELKAKGMVMTADQSSTQWWIGFNMKDPFLGKNKLVRKAIALAYDSKKDIELFGYGAALPANQIIPPNIRGYDTKVPSREHDVAKAKKLMVKAGYPDGRGLPEFNFDTESDTKARQQGEFVRDQLAQIGIRVKVNLHTRPEYYEVRKMGKHQIIMDGWIADYPDPENFLQLLYGPFGSPGMNNSSFQNAEYDHLYIKMAGMSDSPERQKIINRMTDIFLDEQPWVPNWVAKLFNVRQAWLKNYVYSDFAYNVFKYYRVDVQQKKQMIQNF